MANKVSIPVVDFEGKSAGELSAPADIFAIEPNEAVVHFVCEGQRFRFYKKTVSTKGRSQVSGGGKKNRKQKGTGGARQGGTRAPHWVGGGIAFGPTPVKRDFKINKKVRKLALASVLSDRMSGGQIRVVKGALTEAKTQKISKLLGKLAISDARVGIVISSAQDANVQKSARNIKNVDVLTEEKWTTLDFVKTDSLILSEAAFKGLVERFAEGV
jgi:large subunit ribosomal protein L4